MEEIISTSNSGIRYWDVAASKWTKMTASTPTGDIASGDFTGDATADVASVWVSGLWYQDGASLDWTKVSNTAPAQLTAGDVTGPQFFLNLYFGQGQHWHCLINIVGDASCCQPI